MVNSVKGDVGTLKLSDIRDPAGIEAEIEAVQYDLTREMTRLIAAKASQVQVRVEFATPLSDLQQALANFQLNDAGEAFTADMENLPSDAQGQADLHAWFDRNGGLLGQTADEQAQWQNMLGLAGFNAPATKVPVYLATRITVLDDHSNVISRVSGRELVWMDADQRAALEDTMTPASGYNVAGVERLDSSQTTSRADGNTQTISTTAFAIDFAAGPHLSQQEFSDLQGAVDNSFVEAASVLQSDSLHLSFQNANLLNLLEGGEQVVKDMRSARETSYATGLEDDLVRAKQQEVQDRWRDRQSAMPMGAAADAAPLPGSQRSAAFPTTAPQPPKVAPPDLKDDTAEFRPHQPNI